MVTAINGGTVELIAAVIAVSHSVASVLSWNTLAIGTLELIVRTRARTTRTFLGFFTALRQHHRVLGILATRRADILWRRAGAVQFVAPIRAVTGYTVTAGSHRNTALIPTLKLLLCAAGGLAVAGWELTALW